MTILSDDFIDEALVRFARGTRKDFARYIEDAVVARHRPTPQPPLKSVLNMTPKELSREYLGAGPDYELAIAMLRNDIKQATLDLMSGTR